MKSNATILDDRETLELLSEHPKLLAIADAVRATQTRRAAPRRRRLAFALAAACIGGAAATVVFSGLLSSSAPPPFGEPPHFSPIAFSLTRSGGEVTSMDVTVNAATLGGTALLQVVRGTWDGNLPSTDGQVVYEEEVPMTNIASPEIGHPPGTEALSTWSGTLSPSDWHGGCQSVPYWLAVKVSPAKPTREAGGESAQSGFFNCTVALPDGPTGQR